MDGNLTHRILNGYRWVFFLVQAGLNPSSPIIKPFTLTLFIFSSYINQPTWLGYNGEPIW